MASIRVGLLALAFLGAASHRAGADPPGIGGAESNDLPDDDAVMRWCTLHLGLTQRSARSSCAMPLE